MSNLDLLHELYFLSLSKIKVGPRLFTKQVCTNVCMYVSTDSICFEEHEEIEFNIK
jgi:hypothetical protein